MNKKVRSKFLQCFPDGKKGSDMVFPPLMFIILNIVFFGVLLGFVVNASTGAIVYEQAYAKQVALLIDEAKPDMQILVDFEEGIKVAKKNERGSDLIGVDNKTNQVWVNLGSKGGYSYKYFSDYDVTVYDDVKKNLIVINIWDKVWPAVIVDFDKEVSDEDLEKVIAKSNCEDYFELISKYAKKYNVNPVLVLAIIIQESDCNPNAESNKDKVSSARAKGLMQLMDGTARDMGVKNSFNPEENIMGGTKYFRWLLDRYNDDASLALAGYNAGPGNVDKYKGIPPFTETQKYVKEVTERFASFGGGKLNVA